MTQVGFEGSGKIDDLQILAAADAPEFTKYTPSAETVKVTFAALGLADGMSWEGAGDVDVTKDEVIMEAKIPAVNNVEGYTFAGWYSDEAHANAFDITTEVISEAKTIYAYFTKDVVSYTVTFAQKGLPEGTEWTAPTALSIESGKTITSLPNAPAVEGYTFSGWQYDDGTDYNAQEITAATTLYVTYTVVAKDPDPIAPGATATFSDSAKAHTWANNLDNVVVPDVVVNSKATYKSYLYGYVTGNDTDGYTVTFDIAEEKKADLETDLEAALPKVLDGAEIATAVPGFYYAVKACDTVGGEYAVKGNWAQANDDGKVTLSVEKTDGKTAEFYKIVVQAVDPNAAK